MHTYATTKELKKKVFKINGRNIKQAIDVEVTFMMEKELQKEHFLAKKTLPFRQLMCPF